jgi:hypothetical protein
MSLQYYDLALTLNQRDKEFAAQGRFIYYNTGTTPLITAGTALASSRNQAIRVRPFAGGQDIELVPGQGYEISPDEKSPVAWRVSNSNQVETISGQLMIGDGKFIDNNTSNTIRLDATLANNVTVMNTVASRVPVTLDVTQQLRLDPAYPLTIAGNTVQYTNAFADNGTGAVTATVVFTPAANVNGAYVEFAEFSVSNVSSNQYTGTLLAKTSAPATNIDGDVIMTAACVGIGTGTVPAQVNITLPVRIKIAAGKGLYLNQTANAATAQKTVLYTLI